MNSFFRGRASDKVSTEESGVLQLLEHGYVLMPDRGFLIAEFVGLSCAILAVPAFRRGKQQLSSSEAERTRKIAVVRIHIDRFISMVKNKYTNLNASLRAKILRNNSSNECMIDKIAKVCFALTSLCNSVVPFD